MAGRICIIASPPGEAPVWVRQAFVGLTLPYFDVTPSIISILGAITGAQEQSYTGYSVFIIDAINALWHAGRFDAAKWWRQNPRFNENQSLRFPFQACHLVLSRY